MTRAELLKATGSTDNGAFGKALSELVECGFVRRYRIPGKKKHDAVFQLIDNFTLFHFRFLADLDDDGGGTCDIRHDMWTCTQRILERCPV